MPATMSQQRDDALRALLEAIAARAAEEEKGKKADRMRTRRTWYVDVDMGKQAIEAMVAEEFYDRIHLQDGKWIRLAFLDDYVEDINRQIKMVFVGNKSRKILTLVVEHHNSDKNEVKLFLDLCNTWLQRLR